MSTASASVQGNTEVGEVAANTWARWLPRVGWALSAGVIAMLAMSAAMKLNHPPEAVAMFVGKFGYPEAVLGAIGLIELGVVALYAVPRTSVLGAILIAAYLGGATATHVRVGDAFLVPVVIGIVAWLGLYLREPRLRALVPLRRR